MSVDLFIVESEAGESPAVSLWARPVDASSAVITAMNSCFITYEL